MYIGFPNFESAFSCYINHDWPWFLGDPTTIEQSRPDEICSSSTPCLSHLSYYFHELKHGLQLPNVWQRRLTAVLARAFLPSLPLKNVIDLLNITDVGPQVLVGLTCSPLPVVGVGSGAKCDAIPLCCARNVWHGIIAVDCYPVDIGLWGKVDFARSWSPVLDTMQSAFLSARLETWKVQISKVQSWSTFSLYRAYLSPTLAIRWEVNESSQSTSS